MPRLFVLVFIFIALSFLLFSVAFAKWVKNGVVVAARPSDQIAAVATTDGAGGAIIAWHDAGDIRAQRVDANGNVLWAVNGVTVCGALFDQLYPAIDSDDAGGAVIAWQDGRVPANGSDIFAQRIDANGANVWAANGVAVCAFLSTQSQQTVEVVAGVTVVGWQDLRPGIGDIYVQRINPNGSMQWTANGVGVCTAVNNQTFPRITHDGAGGAILTWNDNRSGDSDIYARAVNFLGTPLWTGNGNPIAVHAGTIQSGPVIIPAGVGGSIIVWEDGRFGNQDIFAQSLSAAGTALWTPNGKAICSFTNYQGLPQLASDGADGAIFTWADDRIGSDLNIFAQRVNAIGASLWTFHGVQLTYSASIQHYPSIVTDGSGGAVIAWLDGRLNPQFDIFAQRIDASGLTYWANDGVGVIVTPGTKGRAMFAPAAGGVVAAWDDFRSGDFNVYAQRIELRHGYWGRPEAGISSVADVPNDQGGVVALNYLASERDVLQHQEISHYSIWRAVDVVTSVAREGSANLSLGRRVALSEIGADFDEPAYRVEHTPAVDYFWEFVGTQAAIYAPAYSYLAATRTDMTVGNPATHYFQVVAHTFVPPIFFPSSPASGASEDNLAPAAPIQLMATRTTGSNADLQWTSGVSADDFKEYWIYRAEASGFPTDPANFLMSSPDTVATDATADPSKTLYYKVVAVDVHDNSSDDSNEASVGAIVTDVGDAPAITSLSLRANAPNPFSSSTELHIGLPAASDVTLEVFDVAGRRVAERDVRLGAGWNRVHFDGRDDAGQRLSSGVYFCRVSGAGSSATRKIVVQR